MEGMSRALEGPIARPACHVLDSYLDPLRKLSARFGVILHELPVLEDVVKPGHSPGHPLAQLLCNPWRFVDDPSDPRLAE